MKSLAAGRRPARSCAAPRRGHVPLTLALLLAALAACVGGGLEETAPAGVSLAGTWKLNAARSTDDRQALQQLRARASQHRQSDTEAVPMSPAPGQRQSGPRGGGVQSSDAQLLALPPEPYVVDLSLQSSLLRGGEFLQIEQHPAELVVSNGDTTRSFTAGAKSVVSVPGGVADQRSGWKHKQYVIEIRPQVGPHATVTYELSADGMQLIQTIHVDSEGRVPKLDVTRVYDPASAAPRVVPAGD